MKIKNHITDVDWDTIYHTPELVAHCIKSMLEDKTDKRLVAFGTPTLTPPHLVHLYDEIKEVNWEEEE